MVYSDQEVLEKVKGYEASMVDNHDEQAEMLLAEQKKQTKMDSSQEVEEEDTWSPFGPYAHLVPLIGFVIPFGNILAPLLTMLLARKPELKKTANEVLNMHIWLCIYAVLSYALIPIFIGVPLIVGVGLYSLICCVKGYKSEKMFKTWHKYPIPYRFF